MKFLGIISIILMVYNSSAYAKDNLIPSSLDETSKKTIFNYEDYKKSFFKLKKTKKYKNRRSKYKEIYSYPPNRDNNFDLADYLEQLNKEKLDLSFPNKIKIAKTRSIFLRINPLPKSVTDPLYQESEFYNLADVALQKKLECPITPTVKYEDSKKR